MLTRSRVRHLPPNLNGYIYIYILEENAMYADKERRIQGQRFEKWNIGVNKAQPPGDGGHMWSQFCG